MYISKNLFYIHIWEWMDFEDILFQLENLKLEYFIYDCITEFELPMHYTEKQFNRLANTLEDRGIKMYVLTSSFEAYTDPYPDKLKNLIKIVPIPTYWLDPTLKGIEGRDVPLPEEKKLNKLFFTLINKPHHHRCVLLDKLYQSNCFEFGSHTWNILSGGIFQKYDFKHWTEKKIVDKSQYFDDMNNFTISTQNYNESILELVMESTDRCIFYTEKTFKPLLFAQPILLFGAKTINHNLTKLGFKLHDDIIDYSFDYADTLEERASQLSAELVRLNTIDPLTLHTSLKDVADFNYNHALSLVKDLNNYIIDHIPEDCKSSITTLSNFASVNGFNDLVHRLNSPYIYKNKKQLI
jgi:hypothetical protein